MTQRSSRPEATSRPAGERVPDGLRRFIGLALGGVIGSLAFLIAARSGLAMPALPGAALGLGCGWLGRRPSTAWGVMCGLIAVVLSIWLQWKAFPFVADPGFAYFLQNLHQLPGITSALILLGVVFAVAFGRGGRSGAV